MNSTTLQNSLRTTQINQGAQIAARGEHLTRYSIALVLLWIGAMKFTAYEAGAIEGLVASSPLVSWLYSIASVQGVSNLIGSIEIATALAIVLGQFNRHVALIGASAAIATFAITLSFLFSAPCPARSQRQPAERRLSAEIAQAQRTVREIRRDLLPSQAR